MRINKSRKATALIFVGIFLLLFLCNCLTEPVADDFNYMCSFKTWVRITNVRQILPSMDAHWHNVNGRFVTHFLAQFFLMLPKLIFNIVNSIVFALAIFMAYSFSKTEHDNNILALSIFACVWVFTPVFGQVVLWLDGACNYLWSLFLNLLFLAPFVRLFSSGKKVRSALVPLFALISLAAGAMSENISSAFVFMAVLLVLAAIFVQHRKVPVYYYIFILAACLGFLTILLCPVEAAKSAEFGTVALQTSFGVASKKLRILSPLLIAFAALFVISLIKKMKAERLCLSAIYFLGALFANYVMAAANYYPDRCLMASTVLLIMASAVLAAELFEGKLCALISCIFVVALLCFIFTFPPALNDIYKTRTDMLKNEAYIYESRDSGQMDVILPRIDPQTKYSAPYGLIYLYDDSAQSPNSVMAYYYCVNSITGCD